MPTIEDFRIQSARVAGHAELRDIRTFSLSAELERPPEDGNRLAFNLEPVIETERIDDDTFSVNAFFRLVVIEVADVEPGENGVAVADDLPQVAEVKFKLSALYTTRPFDDSADLAYSEEELTSFAQSTGLLALYPYARALVSDLTSRIGLPALTLPMIKIDIGNEIDDVASSSSQARVAESALASGTVEDSVLV